METADEDDPTEERLGDKSKADVLDNEYRQFMKKLTTHTHTHKADNTHTHTHTTHTHTHTHTVQVALESPAT